MAEQEWDPFAVLGIDASMSPDERKAKYRALVEIFHPDRYGNSSAMVQAEAEERLKGINRAWADLQSGWTSSAGLANDRQSGGDQAEARAADAERRVAKAEAQAAAAEQRARQAESAASKLPRQTPPTQAGKPMSSAGKVREKLDNMSDKQGEQAIVAMRIGAAILGILLLCVAPIIWHLYPQVWAIPLTMVGGAIRMFLFVARGPH